MKNYKNCNAVEKESLIKLLNEYGLIDTHTSLLKIGIIKIYFDNCGNVSKYHNATYSYDIAMIQIINEWPIYGDEIKGSRRWY